MVFMNGIDLGTIPEVVAILLILFVIALFYDQRVARLGIQGEGWIWLEVVVGVLITLVAVGFLDLLLPWNAFFVGLLAFSISGAPMIWGAYQRYREAFGRAQKAFKEK
jgi:hypothetical protein